MFDNVYLRPAPRVLLSYCLKYSVSGKIRDTTIFVQLPAAQDRCIKPGDRAEWRGGGCDEETWPNNLLELPPQQIVPQVIDVSAQHSN